MRRWNNKGMEPITVTLIIIGILVGLYIGNEAGLFSTFTPAGTPPELNPNVNKWYYDTAVQQGTTWECVQSTSVNFRTSDLNYGSGSIEYTASSCGTSLHIYTLGLRESTSNCVASYGSPIMNNLKKSWSAGSTTFNTHSGGGDGVLDLYTDGAGLRVCEDDLDGSGAISQRYTYTATTTSAVSSNINNEMSCGISPVKDTGKYTCEGNNLVTKYCVFNSAVVFPSIINDTCASGLPCQILLGQNVPGVGTRDIAKCSGDYKPNLAICSSSGTSLHTTSSLGFLTTTICGVNFYNVCSNNQCVNCKEGTSWCSGSKTPADCTSGTVVNRADCEGLNYCATTGTAPDTTASCNSPHADNSEDCINNIPSVFHTSTGSYTNKYAFGVCRTSCVVNSNVATCSNDCTANTNYCEAPLSTLYKCDVSQSGNIKLPFNGNSANSQCLSGSCSDANHCSSSYNLNWEYCGGTENKQRQKGVTDNSDPLTGGIIKQDLPVSPCAISCVPDGGNPQKTTCSQLSQCVGKTGTNVCKDPATVGSCNLVGDAFSNTQNCQATNTRGFCNEGPPAFCDVLPAECAGSYGCSASEGKIYSCDTQGYFNKATVLEGCNNLGCSSTIGEIPSSTNSQCTDECIGGYGCLAGDLFTCTTRSGVTDIDAIQKIKSTSQRCTIGSCADAASCTPVKELGRYCNGGSLQEAVQDMTRPLDGNVKLNTLVTCTLSCDTTSSNPPNAKCRSAHEIGTYCVAGNLWESTEDINAIASGGTVQSQIVACDLACDTISANSAKCRGENDIGTYCEGANVLTEIYSDPTAISSGGVRKRTLATCAAGCRGTGSTSAECTPVHELGTYCNANNLWQAVYNPNALSNGFVTTSQIVACAESCTSPSSTYSYCTGRAPGKYCVGSNELWDAVNDSSAISTGGVRYTKLADCVSTCEGVGTNSAKCTKVHEEGEYCNVKDLMRSVTNTGNIAFGGVDISLLQSCNLECQENLNTASCTSQCDGQTECVGNTLTHCNSGILGNPIYTCASDGDLPISCTEEATNEAKCTDLCSLSTVNTCTDSKSYICEKNSTTQQNVNRLTRNCVRGCGTNGFCLSTGVINSYICEDEALYPTDSVGEISSILPLFTCNSEPEKNNLNPYCKPGAAKCTYCELNGDYCIPSEINNSGIKFKCTNELDALGTSTYCDAGCGDGTYCDSLSINYGATSFGIINTGTNSNNSLGDIDLVVTLTGSASHLPIYNARISAVLSGTSTGSVSNLLSDNEGKQTISFHSVPRGKYNVTISVDGYIVKSTEKTRNVYVTDSFLVTPADVQTIFLIPTFTPTAQVRVENPNTHAIPESLIISSQPQNAIIQPPTRSNVDTTKWVINFVGSSPGKYTIGFKPTQSDVNLNDIPEQTVDFEIVKPTLTATLNNPDSTTPGKKDYKLQIAGPRYETGTLSTGGIKPDVAPKATVTFNRITSNLDLLDNGGGEYLISYEFKDAGTYTINIEASKTGYDSAKISKLIQVSDSGTDAPPATDGSGEDLGEDVTTGGIGTTGGINNYILIGIVGIVVWLIATRRKK